jgi:hypothetical protein
MAKFTGDDLKNFLRERLEEQRYLLGKSIKEFASGDLAEAVRMAISIRVLVHESGNSKGRSLTFTFVGPLTPQEKHV